MSAKQGLLTSQDMQNKGALKLSLLPNVPDEPAVFELFPDGSLMPDARKSTRRLGDLRDCFADGAAVEAVLAQNNPIVYEVYELPTSSESHNLLFATTILYAGRVGMEFFMTRGHYHAGPDGSELVQVFKGRGVVLLRTREGKEDIRALREGSVVYVPSGWAHRVVNKGDEPLIFASICAADVGHDYKSLESEGFSSMDAVTVSEQERNGGRAV